MPSKLIPAIPVERFHEAALLGMLASGFFASSDGGATWTERTPPGVGQAMVSAVSPTDPKGVTVVMARPDRAGYVFRSTDGGATWGPG